VAVATKPSFSGATQVKATRLYPACRLYSGSGGGGCTPPNAPNISASPSSINAGGSSTLSASGCGGTVNWSNGASGNSVSVSPTQTTTCSESGCGNGNVTVTVNGGGGGCATGNFNGYLDYADCANFGGWAIDFNDYGRTVQVEILVDGQLVATVAANQSRPDLVAALVGRKRSFTAGTTPYLPTRRGATIPRPP